MMDEISWVFLMCTNDPLAELNSTVEKHRGWKEPVKLTIRLRIYR